MIFITFSLILELKVVCNSVIQIYLLNRKLFLMIFFLAPIDCSKFQH
jgi:hypothetical protein